VLKVRLGNLNIALYKNSEEAPEAIEKAVQLYRQLVQIDE
jgi:hypothetical protein